MEGVSLEYGNADDDAFPKFDKIKLERERGEHTLFSLLAFPPLPRYVWAYLLSLPVLREGVVMQ